MKVLKTPIEGLLVVEPDIYEDNRGYLSETYNKENYFKHGIINNFEQDKKSFSKKGVLRGLHFQKPPYAQAKVVSCLNGEIIDVAVDLRKDSPTYKQHYAIRLSGDNHKQLYIPRGFAHGFVVLSDTALFSYKCDNIYCKESEGAINPFDEELNINWAINQEDVILSEKDKLNPNITEFDNPF